MQKIMVPSKEKLEDLLFKQMLSKKKLANHYGVCIGVIRRWMQQYDLLNKTSVELQVLKRERTRKLKNEAFQGGNIIKPGFNSEFIEEYMVEIEAEKVRRHDNLIKRREEEKAKREAKKAKKAKREAKRTAR